MTNDSGAGQKHPQNSIKVGTGTIMNGNVFHHFRRMSSVPTPWREFPLRQLERGRYLLVVFVLVVDFTTEKGAFMSGLGVLVEAAFKRKRKTAVNGSSAQQGQFQKCQAVNPKIVVADELKKLTPDEQTKRRAEMQKARHFSCPCVPLASHVCHAGS